MMMIILCKQILSITFSTSNSSVELGDFSKDYDDSDDKDVFIN